MPIPHLLGKESSTRLPVPIIYKNLQAELDWNAERTIARVDTYEKLQRYLEEQKKENSYITVLGVQRKLPIDKGGTHERYNYRSCEG